MANRKRRKKNKKDANANKYRQTAKSAFGLDIVVPIFGEWALAEKAITSALSQMESFESFLGQKVRIIVVDNGSPEFRMNDNTTVTPEMASQGVRDLLRTQDVFMRLDKNQGFPGGVNSGVNRGSAPYIMLLSADIELFPMAIENMYKEIVKEDVGMVGIKLLFHPSSKSGPAGMTQHAGHVIGINGQVQHIFIGWNPDHPKVNERREMTSVTGAVFMTERELWRRLGGLNEVYGNGTYEDVEYCLAVKYGGGKKVIYTPAAQAYHYVGASITHGAGQLLQGFRLSTNEQIFRGRNMDYLKWDEYKFY